MRKWVGELSERSSARAQCSPTPISIDLFRSSFSSERERESERELNFVFYWRNRDSIGRRQQLSLISRLNTVRQRMMQRQIARTSDRRQADNWLSFRSNQLPFGKISSINTGSDRQDTLFLARQQHKRKLGKLWKTLENFATLWKMPAVRSECMLHTVINSESADWLEVLTGSSNWRF